VKKGELSRAEAGALDLGFGGRVERLGVEELEDIVALLLQAGWMAQRAYYAGSRSR
jgi:hypothetical protein